MGEYDVAAKKLYSVHTDRMGTPFLLTDKTKAVQWSGVSEPYGRVASSSGSVVQNVRLPGQYDDGAGLYHNGFRDYSPGSLKDPRVGVYLESDPIRLAGGMNVYRYAEGNPLKYVDPRGLEVKYYGRISEPGGTALDPANLNKAPLSPFEVQQVIDALNRISKGESIDDMNPHRYKNYPDDTTGAQLPYCPEGYITFYIRSATGAPGTQRIIIGVGNKESYYYTNNHYQSFYEFKNVVPDNNQCDKCSGDK